MGERCYSDSKSSWCLQKLEEMAPFHSYIKQFEDYNIIIRIIFYSIKNQETDFEVRFKHCHFQRK